MIKSLGRGGAEKLIPETAQVHDQSRFEFHCLYFYHQEQNIIDELERAGIQVHHIPSGNLGLFFQVRKVREFVKEQGFDIIHAHLPWAGILARYVGKKLPIPIVYTEHNTWDRYNKVSYWGNRLTFKNQDVAIAVSNEVALSMQLNSIWDPYKRGGRLKVRVVQNGVNTEVFCKYLVSSSEYQEAREEKQEAGDSSDSYKEKLAVPIAIGSSKDSEEGESSDSKKGIEKLRKELGIPQGMPVIGKVAVFRSQKRLWLWVEIAVRILRKHPEVHFLLVGDGEWKSRIVKQIKESGFEQNFHLVGVQKEVIPYLNLMDIYLSTSEFEGLPIAMLEAMACEVPVVATRAGGIGEVIQNGKQGFLTEIDAWEELEGHCLALLENSELRKEMALAARNQVIENFSMKKMVGALEKIYAEVLKKRVK
ncbi:glycosyl transferase family 4 [Algoriphagus boseongensis]|uniref:Glycosyl transferase family 4 n=1 Tax=Algoriphagus boseongensis TaxID=1442587 RepID=A0A4R6TBH0_9BACT|nr:glycosyltransferase [Algoriphagus boseongensis]TDQ19559.1 glycosyl transferase family 4 [Algoriphagus boseongensis]